VIDSEIVIPEDARQRYLERRQKDVQSLREALQSKTFEEFKRVGHQLKGNAASFGYTDLEKLAVQMEVAGENRDAHDAATQLDLFEKWLAGRLLR
jgi:HPt (histidine-containing phosphotransfer) domain-containing protein